VPSMRCATVACRHVEAQERA